MIKYGCIVVCYKTIQGILKVSVNVFSQKAEPRLYAKHYLEGSIQKFIVYNTKMSTRLWKSIPNILQHIHLIAQTS